jgi:ribonuclease Z
MRPTFFPRLVNGPLFDPLVYVRILNDRSSVLFDCGWFLELSNHEILSLEAVLISHPHMNHFMGLDQVLRTVLHRERPLHIYGPEGITDHVISKLRAYSWNLTKSYRLEVIIHEIRHREMLVTAAPASEGFVPGNTETAALTGPTVARHRRYLMDAVLLDHNIPCLGFVLREPFHINIRGRALLDLGYRTGPWINRLKEHILAGRLQEILQIPSGKGLIETGVKELMDEVVVISRGQKIAYLTDVRFSEENVGRFREIAHRADTLFVEAFYLSELEGQAFRKAHLTARQAGMIGRMLQAKKVVPMHISPRYHQRVDEITREMSET